MSIRMKYCLVAAMAAQTTTVTMAMPLLTVPKCVPRGYCDIYITFIDELKYIFALYILHSLHAVQ